MSINDEELTRYEMQMKNGMLGMTELSAQGKARELMSRYKAIEIAAQFAQQRLGELT